MIVTVLAQPKDDPQEQQKLSLDSTCYVTSGDTNITSDLEPLAKGNMN